MSPVRANVIITSSSLVNEVVEPETYEQSTLKYPDSSVTAAIVNNAKTVESDFFDNRKCPLIVLVESSMVRKNG
jgi:hypothetical protein